MQMYYLVSNEHQEQGKFLNNFRISNIDKKHVFKNWQKITLFRKSNLEKLEKNI